jgi:colanic acid/amylovoran biosynthesis glycosyltransferase
MNRIKLAVVHLYPLNYSETFIRAHIERLDAEVCYYYRDSDWKIEGKDGLIPQWKRDIYRVYGRLVKDETYHIRKAFLQSLKKQKIQVILTEFGYTAAELLPIIEETNLPLIVHFHGLDASNHKILNEYGEAYKAVFQYASWIVAVSEAMRAKLIDLGCSSEKIAVNRCGPDNIFLDIEPNLSEPLFVSVGRFVDKKGPYYTLLAFRELIRDHPEVRLLMAGEGALWNTCKNLVQYFGLQKQVALPGVIRQNEFCDALKVARAYVQHSVTALNGEMEGTPVSVLEASAAGVPVISTRHAGIPDVILHEETGLLVDEHDVKGMAGCMERLLTDVELARQLGHNGKERIRNFFSMHHHISGLNELIRQVAPTRS